ncbi:hypothetical protein MLD38_019811 [Melastoma candidum]|uniref:Uncharacterized protein n=1 Tax=Melastoma candidum TaxID=119954 RepID=A0ACB9QAM1_9MYRT|nr:hypothetical protein MLD38_019811 [Melastoma candidum]
MAKFNVVRKARRAEAAERKRVMHGDPLTGKLRQKQLPKSVSGKRKRKLLKKWRRDQKEAVDKGLITMEDVQMAAADGTEFSLDTAETVPKFRLKKKALKLHRHLKRGKGTNKQPKKRTVDSMVD